MSLDEEVELPLTLPDDTEDSERVTETAPMVNKGCNRVVSRRAPCLGGSNRLVLGLTLTLGLMVILITLIQSSTSTKSGPPADATVEDGDSNLLPSTSSRHEKRLNVLGPAASLWATFPNGTSAKL